MMTLIWILGLFAVVNAGPAAKDANISGYKDQYCTDPRTMRKHAAYTEWADAYSCTRHRCQPGGRNLAIYTVGCKRVEAPESAIECEEVVEDTNMQFPFCCTRLRCLVVVRGEVWTRVLGQPWEVLPAAPWSHMYKMKKPPPSDTAFQPKTSEQGPVYELSEPETDSHDKNLRSGRKVATTDSPDCNEIVPRSAPAAAPSPDIVIALSTNSDKDHIKKSDIARLQGSVQPSGMNWQTQSHGSESESEQKRSRKNQEPSHFFEKDDDRDHHDPDMQDLEDPSGVTDKPPEGSDEKFFENAAFSQKEKQSHKQGLHHQAAWTDIPQNQWNEQHEGMDVESRANVMELRYTQEPSYHHPEYQAPDPEKVERKEKSEKPNNLQALVDAIGTRMRDIENVVQRMSEKVHQTKSPPEFSGERRSSGDLDYGKHHKSEVKDVMKMKHEREREREPSGSEDEQKAKPRFAVRNRGSKYLSPSTDPTSEQPLFIEDNPNYFNDASNAVRRSNLPKLSSVSGADNNDGRAIKEPAQSAPTYMAPVENHRKSPAHIPVAIDTSDDLDRKKKKHTHKKRRNKAHSHKKRHNQDKRKHFNKLTSVEIDKNVVMSMEDSSALVN